MYRSSGTELMSTGSAGLKVSLARMFRFSGNALTDSTKLRALSKLARPGCPPRPETAVRTRLLTSDRSDSTHPCTSMTTAESSRTLSILADSKTDAPKVRSTTSAALVPSSAGKRCGFWTRYTALPCRSSATTLPSGMSSIVPPKSRLAPIPRAISKLMRKS